jgi:hypothetical protein
MHLLWHMASWIEVIYKIEIGIYIRNVIDMDWGLVVKLALPANVTRRANKVIGIYDRSH